MTTHDFTALPDLASRAFGGSVSAANDELFAQRENLIRAEAPYFDPNEFGHKERCTTDGKPVAAATTGTITPSYGSAHRESSTESSSTLRISRATTHRSSR